MSLGIRAQQDQLALFRDDQQLMAVGQEQDLTVAIPALLPFATASFEIHAREDIVVETKNMAAVGDIVIEAWFHAKGGPPLVNVDGFAISLEVNAARAHAHAGAEQHAGFPHDQRLNGTI